MVELTNLEHLFLINCQTWDRWFWAEIQYIIWIRTRWKNRRWSINLCSIKIPRWTRKKSFSWRKCCYWPFPSRTPLGRRFCR